MILKTDGPTDALSRGSSYWSDFGQFLNSKMKQMNAQIKRRNMEMFSYKYYKEN